MPCLLQPGDRDSGGRTAGQGGVVRVPEQGSRAGTLGQGLLRGAPANRALIQGQSQRLGPCVALNRLGEHLPKWFPEPEASRCLPRCRPRNEGGGWGGEPELPPKPITVLGAWMTSPGLEPTASGRPAGMVGSDGPGLGVDRAVSPRTSGQGAPWGRTTHCTRLGEEGPPGRACVLGSSGGVGARVGAGWTSVRRLHQCSLSRDQEARPSR